jgi:hypothetical protein
LAATATVGKFAMQSSCRFFPAALALLGLASPAAAVLQTCARTDTPLPSRAATSVVAADFDNDSDADLAITFNQTPASLVILENDGTGRFTVAQTISPPPVPGDPSTILDPWALIAGNFNGDGFVDLAGTNETSTFFAYLNQGGITGWGPPATPDARRGNGIDMTAVHWDAGASWDLAVCTPSGTVGIALGDESGGIPTGTWGTTVSSMQRFVATPPVGQSVGLLTDIEAADFIADPLDLKDLLTVDQQNSQLVLWPGDPNFSGAVLPTVTIIPLRVSGQPVSPEEAILDDWNGDGIPDVLVVCEDGYLFYFQGNGLPSVFDPPVVQDLVGPLSAGVRMPTRWSGVAYMDMTGDGIRDLVISDAGDAGTQQGFNWLMVVTGTQQAPRPVFDATPGASLFAYPMGDMSALRPGSVAVADFDGDADQDVVVLHGDQLSLTVLHNDGTGRLSAADSFPAGGLAPVAIAAGLLDADSVDDVVVALDSPGDATLRTPHVLLGDRAGGLSEATPLTLPNRPAPTEIFALPLDDNPGLDILESHATEQVLWRSQGPGAWGSPEILAGIAGVVVPGDAAGGSQIDLVTVVRADPGAISVWRNDGNAVFSQAEAFPATVYGYADHVVARLFGGQKADIVVAGLDSRNNPGFYVLRYDDPSGLHAAPIFVGSRDIDPVMLDGAEFRVLATANVDADPAAEIIGVDSSGLAWVLEPQPGPTVSFVLQGLAASLGLTPTALVLRDLNGDGIVDMAVAGTQGLVLVEGLGGGTFAAPIRVPGDISLTGLVTADLDGDGLPELVTTSRNLNDVTVFCNASPGSLNPRVVRNGIDGASISWRPQPGGSYTLLRGDLNDLWLNRDFTLTGRSNCLLMASPLSTYLDASPVPAPAPPTNRGAFYYLVKCALASCSESSFGTSSDGVPRFDAGSRPFPGGTPDPCP